MRMSKVRSILEFVVSLIEFLLGVGKKKTP